MLPWCECPQEAPGGLSVVLSSRKRGSISAGITPGAPSLPAASAGDATLWMPAEGAPRTLSIFPGASLMFWVS